MNTENYILRSRVQPQSHSMASCFLTGTFSICFLLFGIIVTFAGSIITGITYGKPSLASYYITGSRRIIGPILLTVGVASIFISTLLMFICSRMSKSHSHSMLDQENVLATTTTSAQPIPSITFPNVDGPPSEFYNSQYFETNSHISQNYPDLPPPYSEHDPNR